MLAIAAGGAVGALLRYWVSNGVHALTGRGFPYGTLAVNLIGLLGAFTTFSTFSIETLNLIEQAQLAKAGLNAAVSVAGCLAAAWIGLTLGRQL